MSGIGFIKLEDTEKADIGYSFDESVGAMLFDYSAYDDVWGDYFRLTDSFKDGNVQLINNMSEAESFGIRDNAFMNGIPYYHIKAFYDYLKRDAPLYVCFANCKSGGLPDFSAIQAAQQASGKLFQIGVWTEQEIWREETDGKYGFTGVLGNISSNADELDGKINLPSMAPNPLSVIVFANTARLANTGNEVDHKKIPDAIGLGFSKISVVLGQNGGETEHNIQKGNHGSTPVGYMGVFMACLYDASAEISVANVGKYDINLHDDMRFPELGFGGVSNGNYNALGDFNHFRGKILASKGYIIPVTFAAKEAGVYWSSDQTLSNGIYGSISRNRVAHKIRRIIRAIMTPHINGTVPIDSRTLSIAKSDAAIIKSKIDTTITLYMKNNQGMPQINQVTTVISSSKNSTILQNDSIYIDTYVIMVDNSSELHIHMEMT